MDTGLGSMASTATASQLPAIATMMKMSRDRDQQMVDVIAKAGSSGPPPTGGRGQVIDTSA